ncbi:MAG: VWA domain-containing protein [Candidatus Competibacteraceae bacterium]|nr:MAG: VWA domain-containing protein [Candidatus Competibacteraceae bacterium]
MSFWKNLFSKEPVKTEPKQSARNRQLPSQQVAPEFGEVDVLAIDHQYNRILFTILMEPTGSEAEGWQTGVALDASASMQGEFGRLLVTGRCGPLPDVLKHHYEKQGWITKTQQDGITYSTFALPAVQDALERGHLEFTPNTVEPRAREFTAYLADNLDADGGTTVIYWACGDGTKLDVVGDLTGTDCQTASFAGPQNTAFGSSTHLAPAVRYFAERFRDAERGMYLFITDGRLDDLAAVKQYTIGLCREIAAGRRNPLKCVLIGLGDRIDEAQMEELDDLDSGTDVDIWDHKIAHEMRDIKEIFAEVVSENQIIAPTARILDSNGTIVKSFSDGLPAKVTFDLPRSSNWFELEVAGRRIRQSIY